MSASGGHRAGRCLEQHLRALLSFRIGPSESLEVCRCVQGGITELDGLDGGTGALVTRLSAYGDDRCPPGCGRRRCRGDIGASTTVNTESTPNVGDQVGVVPGERLDRPVGGWGREHRHGFGLTTSVCGLGTPSVRAVGERHDEAESGWRITGGNGPKRNTRSPVRCPRSLLGATVPAGYKAAIDDGYFTFVVLDTRQPSAITRAVVTEMRARGQLPFGDGGALHDVSWTGTYRLPRLCGVRWQFGFTRERGAGGEQVAQVGLVALQVAWFDHDVAGPAVQQRAVSVGQHRWQSEAP